MAENDQTLIPFPFFLSLSTHYIPLLFATLQVDRPSLSQADRPSTVSTGSTAVASSASTQAGRRRVRVVSLLLLCEIEGRMTQA